METGYLNKYFSGVIVKKLSEVEANIESSNHHSAYLLANLIIWK